MNRECPRCGGHLEDQVFADDLSYQKCHGCSGLLMHEAVFRGLKEAWLSERLVDPIELPVGVKIDESITMNCPSCGDRMDKLIDEVQSHVCLDHCAACELLFFDAGEFTDLKQLTFMDYIWAFLARFKTS